MLKFINYQLDTEDKQKLIEQDLAQHIKQQLLNNMQAIQQYQPHLMPLINQLQLSDYAIFCTKQGKANLASMNSGQVVYQADPEEEIRAEVQDFLQLAPLTRLRALDTPAKAEPLPVKVDVLLVFGLGLGHHLLELLQNCRISYLVIYEPQTDFFLGSLQTIDWRQVFEIAQLAGTQISLQIGNDGSSVVEDLQELRELLPAIDQVYLYRHLCHAVTDEVFRFLLDNSGVPSRLFKKGQQFLGFQEAENYIGSRAKNVLGKEIPDSQAFDTEKFNTNMAVFKRFYPKIYEAFKQYKPRNWQLWRDTEGNYNLWHCHRNVFLYDDLEYDSALLINRFLDEPFKEDVIIGLAPSKKLRSFLHYKYIEKLQSVFQKFNSTKTVLPDNVDSIIVFGTALAKHIYKLTNERDIRNLYICEPNLDFFYASLYVTDWADIIQQAEIKEHRIYLNIGGNGSEYFHDLMGQFYQVGAYSIANTYLLQSYYTPQLSKAIYSLRQQLKVVLAVGEYYDHVRYGIAHTHFSVQHHQFLRKNWHNETSDAILQLPIFVIGNGPSLDDCFDYLRQCRDKVIIISCGTALRSLHKKGIQPDFHAEIEQNRATYDWITQVDDAEYLKGINLISVNGIHPDTAALFKNTLLAFKQGESSSYLFHNGLKKTGAEIVSLAYAYPTVTNLVVNYMLNAGFRFFYLFGVDLGYVDIKQHHSKFSAYYKKDGNEIYNYQKVHGNSLPSPGNFRPVVFTKTEFDVSRKLLEQALANVSKAVEVYNCSDGVKIAGAVALAPEYILLAENKAPKSELLQQFIKEAYYPCFSEQADLIYGQLDMARLEQSVDEWLRLIAEDASSKAAAQALIEKQWLHLRLHAQDHTNLCFYLFYGSANYILSILTKLMAATDDQDIASFAVFNEVLGLWRDYLSEAVSSYKAEPMRFDGVSVSAMFN